MLLLNQTKCCFCENVKMQKGLCVVRLRDIIGVRGLNIQFIQYKIQYIY